MHGHCALVPVYNHPGTIADVCHQLHGLGLPVLLVDDGSDAECAAVLDALQLAGNQLLRLPENRGKGAAVRAGLAHAEKLGYSHALQVDADGQHALDDLPSFLAAMQTQPKALVIGYPHYDESVSKLRFYGRYATHIWVWINTLSLDIRDSMCGARIYPLSAVNPMLVEHGCGDRMAFDTEVLVRWHWQRGEVINLPVHVHYPEGGVSHFNLWRDNLHISAMHARLFFGMLCRAPGWALRSLRGGGST